MSQHRPLPCPHGPRCAAMEAFKAAEAKTAGVGPKMDLCFSQIRCAGMPLGQRNLSCTLSNVPLLGLLLLLPPSLLRAA